MHCRTCAILAGGAAKRFGGVVKSKIPVGGTPVIRRILDVTIPLFDEVFIVSNTPEEFSEYGIRIVPDIIKGIGPLGGIHTALKAASDEAVFVLAGDMPLPDKKIISLMLERFKDGKGLILTPFSGSQVEPLHSIYPVSVYQAIEEYVRKSGNSAVYDFFRHAGTEHFEHDNSEPFRRAFMNINVPEDIDKAEKLLADI